MNSRFYVTAVLALLLAAAYNGAARRSEQAPESGPDPTADVHSAQPPAPVTARSSPPSQRAALPRS